LEIVVGDERSKVLFQEVVSISSSRSVKNARETERQRIKR
jgi:hypothetical protein